MTDPMSSAKARVVVSLDIAFSALAEAIDHKDEDGAGGGASLDDT